MDHMTLPEMLEVVTEMEASATAMAAKCSGYQEATRVLHRELEYLLQLHHKEPDIFDLNPDINRYALEFFKASRLLTQEAEKMQAVGLDTAEHNLNLVRERFKHPDHFEDLQMVNQIDTLLKSSKHKIQLARGHVNQLNAYVQYHARVLKTIKLD